jgi:hypothetical protein
LTPQPGVPLGAPTRHDSVRNAKQEQDRREHESDLADSEIAKRNRRIHASVLCGLPGRYDWAGLRPSRGLAPRDTSRSCRSHRRRRACRLLAETSPCHYDPSRPRRAQGLYHRRGLPASAAASTHVDRVVLRPGQTPPLLRAAPTANSRWSACRRKRRNRCAAWSGAARRFSARSSRAGISS